MKVDMVPLNDPVGAIVGGADTGNIDSVFIAGRAMKRHGQFVNVDVAHARKLAVESRDYVVTKSGFALASV